jgi:hypothetical protein
MREGTAVDNNLLDKAQASSSEACQTNSEKTEIVIIIRDGQVVHFEQRVIING